jgi:hypothetical protein
LAHGGSIPPVGIGIDEAGEDQMHTTGKRVGAKRDNEHGSHAWRNDRIPVQLAVITGRGDLASPRIRRVTMVPSCEVIPNNETIDTGSNYGTTDAEPDDGTIDGESGAETAAASTERGRPELKREYGRAWI